MKFIETKLKGSFIIDLELIQDNRGFFARTFCSQEFEAQGLKPLIVQSNISFNYQKGTLRGLHYQIQPATEAKLIRCTRGAIYDVMVDMRSQSPTFLQYVGVELTAQNHRALYVPDLFAHGYQSLTDETEVIYQVSEFYAPEYEKGIRYNDPMLSIEWPLPVTEISVKDQSWPLLKF